MNEEQHLVQACKERPKKCILFRKEVYREESCGSEAGEDKGTPLSVLTCFQREVECNCNIADA